MIKPRDIVLFFSAITISLGAVLALQLLGIDSMIAAWGIGAGTPFGVAAIMTFWGMGG